MNGFPYDAVIFDLDGTLFDAEEGIVSSVRYAMDTLGLPIPEGVSLREVVGPPLRASLKDLLRVPPELVEDVMNVYRQDFSTRGSKLYSVYPHIRGILQTLKDGGVHVALATGKPQALAEDIMRAYALDGYFTRMIGECENAAKSGKPDLVRRALPDTYERACMVGDRRFDAEGALANGIEAIGVGYGCGTEEELTRAGVTRYVATTAQLRTVLCGDVPPPRGFFLTVEGPDGSGKTTQVDRLEASLRRFGFDVLRTREPGGCAISEEIRRVVLSAEHMEMSDTCEALLYAAARAQHVHQVIRPAVESGKVVLCDRFVDSSVAYQGGGRELGVELVERINAPAVDGMLPDATLYLSIDHETALRRRLSATAPDRLELQAMAFHARVQAAYEALLERDPDRFLVVDASRDVDTVAEAALSCVLPRLLEQR